LDYHLEQFYTFSEPSAAPLYPECMDTNSDSSLVYHPIIFEALDGSVMRAAALHTSGSAGPSGLDAYGWRRLCSSFKSASDELCCSLAILAHRLCTSFVNPEVILPLVSCRLIALDKNPGVRPIGVGEVVRRIIAKAVLSIIRPDILRAAGPLQLCAGQTCGVEAAIHSMRTIFNDENSEGFLLVDASNAFNSLNRAVALQNIQYTCPAFSTILINTYRFPAPLYVDGDVIYSNEGTTQGDPLAMPFYALATIPLIRRLPNNVIHAWYADDASACGEISLLRQWWDKLSILGPPFGYFPNASKTWLVVKEQFLKRAQLIFADTCVNVTTDGRPHLGAAIGSTAYISQYVSSKVTGWIQELQSLSSFAITQPHAAYSAFTHGLVSKWLFIARTIPNIDDLFQPLEECIRHTFIPAVTGHLSPGNLERDLLALPTRIGGMGIVNPVRMCAFEFTASNKVTMPLQTLLLSQSSTFPSDIRGEQFSIKKEIYRLKSSMTSSNKTTLLEGATTSLKRSIELASEKGASNWLTVLPLQEHHFSLHKTAFHDSVALRYGWDPARLPLHCACGAKLTVEHSFTCPKGGFPSIRHNEIRDLTASLLTEVCHEVEVEPHLQPITDEKFILASSNIQDGARLDIAVNGFWGCRSEKTYVDVKVFNPHAPSNRASSARAIYRKHELCKKRSYEARIREVEQSSFTPLIFSATGGMANEATLFYKRLASLLSDKWDSNYAAVMGWVRCCLSFSLLRSAIRCLRGSRSSKGSFGYPSGPMPIDLIQVESRLPSFTQ